MTLRELAIEVLKSSKEPMSVLEIWKKAQELGLLNKIQAQGKNPYTTFTSVLYTDFKRVNNTFIVHSNNPKKFSLNTKFLIKK